MSSRPRVAPANEASWEDVEAIFFGSDDDPCCWCQWYRTAPGRWADHSPAERAALLREQTRAGQPDAARSTGLVAYVGGRPAGWVAVEPRRAYERLSRGGAEATGSGESPDDPEVWSVTCFLVRPGFRGLGVTRALLAAAVARAREHGASAVEGYTRVLEQDGDPEEYGSVAGSRDVFAEAGFVEVPGSPRGRRVLRLE